MQASSLDRHWSHYGVGVVAPSNTQLWTLKAGVLARSAPGGHWRAGTEEGLRGLHTRGMGLPSGKFPGLKGPWWGFPWGMSQGCRSSRISFCRCRIRRLQERSKTHLMKLLNIRPVRYFDNIVYHDNFSNIAIRYFLLAIAITATEIIMR